jgi:hypothetical protein
MTKLNTATKIVCTVGKGVARGGFSVMLHLRQLLAFRIRQYKVTVHLVDGTRYDI